MSESEAIVAYGVTVEVTNGPDTSSGWFELGEVVDVNPPEDSTDLVDVTHQKSPGRRKEFKSGLTEGGEGSFPLNWIPQNPTDEFCQGWQAAGENRQMRLTWPNGATMQYPATYRGFSRGAQIGQKMSGTLTVKMAGEPTYGAGA
jgi:hypothetical protein